MIGGTLPFFVPTEARTRLSPRATAGRLTGLLAVEIVAVVAAALTAYVAGLVGLATLLPRLGRRQLRWAGPRLVHLVAGMAWWGASVLAVAWSVRHGGAAFGERPLAILVVCGFGQILWGTLAYLLPVLRGGGHQRLSAGFAGTRSWTTLAAANLVGVAVVAGVPRAAAILGAAWVGEAAVRVVRLRPATIGA